MKVILADDHALIRAGMRALLLTLAPDAEVIEAADYAQVMTALDHHPEVALIMLDLGMPGTDGLEGFLEVRRRCPDGKVVVLSAVEDPAVVRTVLERGGAGYVPKALDPEVMVSALKLVLAGGVYVPPLALKAVGLMVAGDGAADENGPGNGGGGGGGGGGGVPPNFTERQVAVLRLMVQGCSNKEIARKLTLSESTVKTHVASVMRLLNANSRMKAVHAATGLGLVRP